MIDSSTDFFKHVDNFAKYSHIGWRIVYGDESLLSKAKVTISIPTYRRPDTLKCAIDSALNQEGYDNYCVLVVDNEPLNNTETERLVKSYHSDILLYVKNSDNTGMFGNQNRCFEIPESEYVVLLHDDDLLMPNYLKTCIAILNNHPMDALIPGKVIWKEKECSLNDLHIPQTQKNLKPVHYLDNYYNYIVGSHSGGLFRRQAFLNIGGYNDEFYPTSDYCMIMNFLKKFTLYMYSEKLSIYRVSGNASTKCSVLSQTVYNDYFLRSQIFKECGFSKIVTWIILNYRVHSQVKGLRSSFNKDFEFDMSQIGMNVKIPRFLFIPFRIYTEFKVHILKKRKKV